MRKMPAHKPSSISEPPTIDAYTWATPNGHKVHIMLEECSLPYVAPPVNIGTGDQFSPAFLRISPNNKIPAITDPDGPDGNRSLCSNRALSWCISRARLAS